MGTKIYDTIKTHKMINQNEEITVALSGGADSVVLLHSLISLKNHLNPAEISAVHINHNLRGEAAEADQNFVINLCKKWNINLEIFQTDVNHLAATLKIGIEEAGRQARYSIFNKIPNKVALGHNSDDVSETIIMNLCRGAGLRGLCGIPPINGKIIRPLIETSRVEIEAYIKKYNLEHITDQSNFSNDYTRNRIRNQIIPAIESAINPKARQTISKNAALMRDDEDFLNQQAQQALKNCRIQPYYTDEISRLDITKLTALHKALARRVIRLAIFDIRQKDENISKAHIEAILNLVAGETGKTAHLPDITAQKSYNLLILQKHKQEPKGFCYPIKLGDTLNIPEIGKNATFSKFPSEFNAKYCTKAFECDMVSGDFFIRTRQPGDKIILSGKNGNFTKKLQDYFTDLKIPKHERDSIPLLAKENEIICILTKNGRINANYNKDKYYITIWGEEECWNFQTEKK